MGGFLLAIRIQTNFRGKCAISSRKMIFFLNEKDVLKATISEGEVWRVCA